MHKDLSIQILSVWSCLTIRTSSNMGKNNKCIFYIALQLYMLFAITRVYIFFKDNRIVKRLVSFCFQSPFFEIPLNFLSQRCNTK